LQACKKVLGNFIISTNRDAMYNKPKIYINHLKNEAELNQLELPSPISNICFTKQKSINQVTTLMWSINLQQRLHSCMVIKALTHQRSITHTTSFSFFNSYWLRTVKRDRTVVFAPTNAASGIEILLNKMTTLLVMVNAFDAVTPFDLLT